MRRAAAARLALGGGLLAIVALLGACATPPAPPPPAASVRSTRLELVNLGPNTWSLVLTDAAGREARVARVPADATLALTLPAGDYTVTQTALDGPARNVAPRRFPLTLAPGGDYRWPLGTLLTGAAGSTP